MYIRIVYAYSSESKVCIIDWRMYLLYVYKGRLDNYNNLTICPSFLSSSAGLDVAPLSEEALVSSQSNQGRVSHQDEPLDGILSPELDKMVTDGQWVQLH